MGDELIVAMARLVAVLDAENVALAAGDAASAARGQAGKAAALAAFADAHGRAGAGMADAALRGMAERLDRAAAENRRLLEQAIAVQGRVLEIVTRALPVPDAPYRPARHSAGARGPAPVVLSARV